VISAVSSSPADNIPDLGFVGADKFVHFTEFLVFGIILLRALSGSNLKINLFWTVVLSIIISCFYAAIDELHQLFIPGRQADIFDFFADVSGALLGIFLYFRRSLSCRR
jgi:VanZ family protein